MAKPLSEERRREVFVALVAAQDAGLSVAESRARVATQFGVDEKIVAAIEKEGLKEEWPPLGE
jgi:hypothetical protein